VPLSYDQIFDRRAIIGDPEQCIAKIEALRNEGIGYFGCNFAMGGIDHRKVMRSMKLFAEKVMPEFS
jgi:alkanesulfonate monooxygenase SsuD/methylene tetrahydromethanopterin reductase-like flavin-dependent oxidoreductase (luciferase family)